MMKPHYSRREFLKLCTTGMAGLMLPLDKLYRLEGDTATRINTRFLGRVQQDRYPLYEAPSVNSEVIAELALDDVLAITKFSAGRDGKPGNRIWYELDERGFAHSRRIQPVKMLLNAPAKFIPESGCLGEITTPFVDAYARVGKDSKRLYRFYYSATFWVTGLETYDDGSVWYQLLDDRYYTKFYVPAENVRLVPDTELTGLSPQVPFEEKKLVVDLATQTLSAYIGEKWITTLRISTGIRLAEGGFATPRGNYRITRKRPCRHMYAAPSEFGSGFDLPGVPWVSYYTGDGVAFHGTYWHNNFGNPMSHGCINMASQLAKWVYRWTTPTVPHDKYYYADNAGTRVVVQ